MPLAGRLPQLQRGDAIADDPNVRHGQDRNRINLTQPHEVAYWTKTLGVNEELLRKVVAEVGDRVDAVRKHLGR